MGRPDPGPGHRPTSAVRIITPDYFNAMKIPVEEGRAFAETNTDKSPKVVIINEGHIVIEDQVANLTRDRTLEDVFIEAITRDSGDGSRASAAAES